jgi:hypothetical protein
MMASFKKKFYTEPVISKHNNDLSKDWYVFFRFKNDGKVHNFKRREGVNHFKTLESRIEEIEILRNNIHFDLQYGWNPLTDRKREIVYGPPIPIVPHYPQKLFYKQTKAERKKEIFLHFYNKGAKNE